MNSLVITTNDAHERHSSVFYQLNRVLDKEFKFHFLPPILECEKDLFIKANYIPSKWNTHIQKIFTLLFINIIKNKTKDLKVISPISCLNHLTADLSYEEISSQIFPSRSLSEVELDILFKHYLAIKYASQQSSATLVLEDDFIISSSKTFKNFYLANQARWKTPGDQIFFDDICDYPCFYDHYITDSNPKGIFLNRLSITRTVCAYIVSPYCAKQLLAMFYPFSLPIDFHLQYLLYISGTKGMLPLPGLIKNGSQMEFFDSLISENTSLG